MADEPLETLGARDNTSVELPPSDHFAPTHDIDCSSLDLDFVE